MRAVRLSLSPRHLEVELRVGEQRGEVLEAGPVAGLLGVHARDGVDAQQRRVLLVVRRRPAGALDVVALAQREAPGLADRDVDVLGRRQVAVAAQEAVALVAQVEQPLDLDQLAGVGLLLAAALQLAAALGRARGRGGGGCGGCRRRRRPGCRFWLFWLFWFRLRLLPCWLLLVVPGCPADVALAALRVLVAVALVLPVLPWRRVGAVGQLGRLDEDRRSGVAVGSPPPWRWSPPGRWPRPRRLGRPLVAAAPRRRRPARCRRRRPPGSGGPAWRRCRGLAAVAVAPAAVAGPEVTPVASRIWSMMSAFFVRVVVLSDMAWAMALSSSRSLPSRTDRSSCCSAVIGLLFQEGCRRLGLVRAWRGNFREEKGLACECPPPDHLCVMLSRDRLYPRRALRSAVGMSITLAGAERVMPTHPAFPQVRPVPDAGLRPALQGDLGQDRRRARGRSPWAPRSALMARSGSFSPWPVSTQTTVEPSGTPVLEQAGHRGRRRRLAEDGLLLGQEACRRRGSPRR